MYDELIDSFEALYAKEEKEEEKIEYEIFLKEHEKLISENGMTLDVFKLISSRLEQEILIQGWKKEKALKRSSIMKNSENAEVASRHQLEGFVEDAKREIEIKKFKDDIYENHELNNLKEQGIQEASRDNLLMMNKVDWNRKKTLFLFGKSRGIDLELGPDPGMYRKDDLFKKDQKQKRVSKKQRIRKIVESRKELASQSHDIDLKMTDPAFLTNMLDYCKKESYKKMNVEERNRQLVLKTARMEQESIKDKIEDIQRYKIEENSDDEDTLDQLLAKGDNGSTLSNHSDLEGEDDSSESLDPFADDYEDQVEMRKERRKERRKLKKQQQQLMEIEVNSIISTSSGSSSRRNIKKLKNGSINNSKAHKFGDNSQPHNQLGAGEADLTKIIEISEGEEEEEGIEEVQTLKYRNNPDSKSKKFIQMDRGGIRNSYDINNSQNDESQTVKINPQLQNWLQIEDTSEEEEDHNNEEDSFNFSKPKKPIHKSELFKVQTKEVEKKDNNLMNYMSGGFITSKETGGSQYVSQTDRYIKLKKILKRSQKTDKRPLSFDLTSKNTDGQEPNSIIKLLLSLLGIPWVDSPSEAEAQCVKLELLGLVDGTLTEDSDTFLFGAKNVYKDFFKEQERVQVYSANRIKNCLGLDRERLIMMALFLGCDYTEGVSGIGIVNGMEIVDAFRSFEALYRFKEWAQRPDLWTKPEIYEKAKGKQYIFQYLVCTN